MQLTAGHRYRLGYTQLDCTVGLGIRDEEGRVLAASTSETGEEAPAVPEPLTITAAAGGTYDLDLAWDAQRDDEHGCPAGYGFLLRELL